MTDTDKISSPIVALIKSVADDNTPAALFAVAFSDESAASQLARLEKSFPGVSFEVVPNTPSAPAPSNAAELDALRAFKQAVIDNTGTDDPHTMAQAFRLAENFSSRIAALDAREEAIAARESALAPAAAPEALPPVTFAAGDFVRDTFSETVVRVDAIDDTGFSTTNPATMETGRVPRTAAIDYAKLTTADAAPFSAMLEKNRPASPTIDATAGASPEFPFGVGDTVRDIHTGAAVTVTAVGAGCVLNPNPITRGFDWYFPGATPPVGHCPLNAVGNFELQGARVSTPAK